MGEFRAGTWLIAGFVYFFVIFLATWVVFSGANEMGIDTTDVRFDDPGFQSLQPINGKRCIGTITPFCGSIPSSTIDADRCNTITGCTYSVQRERCEGEHGITECGVITNSTLCIMVGCSFTEDNSATSDTLTFSNVKQFTEVMGFVSGFRANVGIPPTFQFVFSVFFFWIPFFLFLWAFYMAIPFFH